MNLRIYESSKICYILNELREFRENFRFCSANENWNTNENFRSLSQKFSLKDFTKYRERA